MHEELSAKAPKLLRHRGTEGGTVTGFVEAFRFTEGDRTDLEQLLEKQQVGDPEGRRLLIAATEYEIGLCLDAAAHHPGIESKIEQRPAPGDGASGELQPVATAAETLSALLDDSSQASRRDIASRMSASDPLGRTYDERFFACLASELERLAACCRSNAGETPVPPPLAEHIQNFLRQMSEIYSECIEIQPSAAPDDPFYQYLDIIMEIGQIGPLPSGSLLQQLIESD